MSRLAVFLLLVAVAVPTFAQQLTESIDVSIINVDVFVTDRQGNRVRGLTADDFEIRENGKVQPVTNFAEYSPQAKAEAGTVTVESGAVESTVSAAPPAKRTIVIFVDLVPQPSVRIRETFAGLRDFVRKAVRQGDAATIVAFDARLQTRQPFTDDTAALLGALDTLEKESIGVAPDPHDALRRAMASDAAASTSMSARGLQRLGDTASAANLERMSEELFDLISMGRKTAAMNSIMESMSGVEGKKIMLLALHRYGLIPGAHATMGIASPPPPADARVWQMRRSLMRTANANGITLYPLYAPGIQWATHRDAQEERINVFRRGAVEDLVMTAGDHGRLMNQTASLIEIAQETGGLMASGPSDIVDLLPRVVDDLESYYSLAYRATPTGKDARRAVVVRTKNRDYQVRSRRAVVEKSDDTQMDDRVVANLFQPLEHSVIPIRADLGAVKKVRKNRWIVPVVVRIPVSALTTLEQDGAAKGAFSVFIGTGGDFAVVSDVTRKEQPYSIRLDELQNAKATSFTYNVAVEFDQFAEMISIGVRDDVSKEFGVVRLPIRMPTQADGR
jgi:VWFA-related protein